MAKREQPAKITRFHVVFLIAATVILSALIQFRLTNNELDNCVQTGTLSRVASGSGPGVTGRWAKKVNLGAHWIIKFGSPLAIYNGTIAVVSWDCGAVLAFDASTGDLRWDQKLAEPSFIVLDEQRNTIYVTGTFVTLTALDLRDGSIVWSNHTLQFSRQGISIDPSVNGKPLTYLLRGSLANAIYVTDPNTGRFEDTLNVPERTFLYLEDTAFIHPNLSLSVQAIDTVHNQLLWERPNLLASPLSQAIKAKIVDDVLVIYDGEKISALNRHNGALLWQAGRPITSNFAVFGENLYALDLDRNLLIVNVKTGAVQEIAFDHTIDEVNEEASSSYPDWIAVSNGVMAFFIQDTQTLSVFEVSEPL